MTVERINVRCWIWGHSLDWPEHSSMPVCARCDAVGYEAALWPPLRERVMDWWRRVTWRCRRCPDCGRIWGRHDPVCDDIPF